MAGTLETRKYRGLRSLDLFTGAEGAALWTVTSDFGTQAAIRDGMHPSIRVHLPFTLASLASLARALAIVSAGTAIGCAAPIEEDADDSTAAQSSGSGSDATQVVYRDTVGFASPLELAAVSKAKIYVVAGEASEIVEAGVGKASDTRVVDESDRRMRVVGATGAGAAVYWGIRDDATATFYAFDGAKKTKLTTVGAYDAPAGRAHQLSTDGTDLVWVALEKAKPSQLARVSVKGGAAERFGSICQGGAMSGKICNVEELAMEGDAVYVAEQATGGGSRVTRTSKATGRTEVLPLFGAADGMVDDDIHGVVADGESVYAAFRDKGVIQYKDGKTTVFAKTTTSAIAQDETRVFYVDTKEAVWAKKKSGGNAVRVGALSPTKKGAFLQASALSVVGDDVFVTTMQDGEREKEYVRSIVRIDLAKKK